MYENILILGASLLQKPAIQSAKELGCKVFVVDGKEGLTSNDFVVRDMLLKVNKKVIVAINKTDSKLFKDHMYDFYELGFDNYINISSEQNEGIYDLLEEIFSPTL